MGFVQVTRLTNTTGLRGRPGGKRVFARRHHPCHPSRPSPLTCVGDGAGCGAGVGVDAAREAAQAGRHGRGSAQQPREASEPGRCQGTLLPAAPLEQQAPLTRRLPVPWMHRRLRRPLACQPAQEERATSGATSDAVASGVECGTSPTKPSSRRHAQPSPLVTSSPVSSSMASKISSIVSADCTLSSPPSSAGLAAAFASSLRLSGAAEAQDAHRSRHASSTGAVRSPIAERSGGDRG